MFGKRKKEQKLNEELARVNAEIEQRKSGLNQVPFKSAINKNREPILNELEEIQREETAHIRQPLRQPAPVEQPKEVARIVSCEVLNNENNLFRITLITNALLGNVGEEFEI